MYVERRHHHHSGTVMRNQISSKYYFITIVMSIACISVYTGLKTSTHSAHKTKAFGHRSRDERRKLQKKDKSGFAHWKRSFFIVNLQFKFPSFLSAVVKFCETFGVQTITAPGRYGVSMILWVCPQPVATSFWRFVSWPMHRIDKRFIG